MTNLSPDTNERIGRLEIAAEGFHNEFRDIKTSLHVIEEKLSASGRTNWPVIFQGLALVGALYFAAVRPLAEDIVRQSREAETLATAVLVANERVTQFQSNTESRLRLMEFKLDSLSLSLSLSPGKINTP